MPCDSFRLAGRTHAGFIEPGILRRNRFEHSYRKEVSLKNPHQKIKELLDRKKVFALVLVLHAEGSTPVPAGARMLVGKSGKTWGTVGGGLVEGEAKARAAEALERGEADVFDFDLNHAYGQSNGTGVLPICGGTMRLLVLPRPTGMRGACSAAEKALRNRMRGVLLTRIDATRPRTIESHFVFEEELSGLKGFPARDALEACLESGAPALFRHEAQGGYPPYEVFAEPILPAPKLIIAGAGHVGQALARYAHSAGFEVTVIDDRREYARAERFPREVTVCRWSMQELHARLDTDGETYIALVTRGYKTDAEFLEQCLRLPCAFLGMIGSKRKVALVRKALLETGKATEEELARVHAPIGLDIGAVTVPEIAIAITAQLIEARRKNTRSAPETPVPC